jgi:dipeptidyl aminopeptidase/acylaminoacyl peptidase
MTRFGGIGVLAAALAGCAPLPAVLPPTPVAAADAAELKPNPHLHPQNLPAIPMALAQAVAPYAALADDRFVAWHPTQREMVVAHQAPGGRTRQLFRLAAPLAAPEQLTNEADPVTQAWFEPQHGEFLVFQRGRDGDEADRIYRLDLAGHRITALTPPGRRYLIQGWLHDGRLLVGSMPLAHPGSTDETAPVGDGPPPPADAQQPELPTAVASATARMTLAAVDPRQPDSLHRLVELDGTGWTVGEVSADDRSVVLTRLRSATAAEVVRLDLESRRLTPLAGGAAARFAGRGAPAGMARIAPSDALPGDAATLLLISDQGSEFRELIDIDAASGRTRALSRHIAHDVRSISVSGDHRWAAASFDVAGRSELHLFDLVSGAERPLPALPPGSVTAIRFHSTLPELAVTLDSAQSPPSVWSFDVETGRVERWTRPPRPRGVDPSRFADAQTIAWTSFDGRAITGLINRPPSGSAGRRSPVLILLHGGPEAQAGVGFLGAWNYLIDRRGVTLIQPNVRGSTGFGKQFLKLDNGRLRDDAVRDVSALLDWIATQPDLDPSRVMVAGTSYGGYLSLALAAREAARLVGAISIAGISNLVSYLEHTEAYRRDLRRAEYGDERDPAMREFLESISPLNHAGRITRPLFVAAGDHDPRVPVSEAEQIVERVRRNGTPVWWLRADNEGHGFARAENAEFLFLAQLRFIEEYLLK